MLSKVVLVRRFQEHLATLERAPGKAAVRLGFQRAIGAGGLHQVLRACFDEMTTDYLMPDEGAFVHGATYWLTPAGDGLRLAHQPTGAVVGDAYTDFFDLLLGGDALVSM